MQVGIELLAGFEIDQHRRLGSRLRSDTAADQVAGQQMTQTLNVCLFDHFVGVLTQTAGENHLLLQQ